MNVHVTRSEGVGRVLSSAVPALAIVAFGWAARPVLVPLLLAALLAFVLEPIAGTLERLRIPPALASVTAVVVLLGALYGGAALLRDDVLELVRTLPPHAVSLLRASLGSPTELLVMACVLPLLVYVMLSWRAHLFEAIALLFPPPGQPDARGSLDTIVAIIRHFLLGNLMAGAFVGAALTLLFALLGVPHYGVLGPLAGFLSVVPYLGTLLGLLPPFLAGWASLTVGEALSIVLAIAVLRTIGLAALYPMFVGGRLNVNPLTILIALLFGGWLWGAFGVLLAIPVAGALKAIFDQVESLRGWAMLMGDDEVAPE